ncbi:MAG: HIT family protein [Bacteroidales bacterium]|nr:HIT family protein [Bacteroidales bacterium]
MATLFSKIVNGQIPCYKITEDDRYFAFLDINPLVKGHTLVIPKEETDYFFDIDDDTLGGIVVFAKRIALAIEKVVSCRRVGVVVLGLEVPHAHIHLIPLHRESDINFSNKRVKLTEEEFRQIAENIRNNLV